MKTHRPYPAPDAGVPAPEETELASLLRAAGPRPEPPARDKEVVKAAALAQWQWTVRQERRRRVFRRASVALAAAALAVVILQPGLRRQLGLGRSVPLGTVEVAMGDVSGGLGTESRPLTVGTDLFPGSLVETAEVGVGSAGSRALLRLVGGSGLRLDDGSRLRLLAEGVLALDRGAIYVDSGPGGAAVEIHTPLGEVRDIGTRFEVRLEEGSSSLRVRVRDGEVELKHAGVTHVAGAGEEMLQGADGTFARGAVKPYGEAWDWVVAILPRFVIEGRSLAEFLRWVAHEGGWELRYSDPSLEAMAAEVVLYGSVEGLALEDAAAAMLAGSGLTHRLTDGALEVRRIR